MNCIRCNREHKGTWMRTNYPRHTRIYTILMDPAMPRDAEGRPSLCHYCQRWICWHGGIVTFLANQVKKQAIMRGVVVERAWRVQP